MQTQRRLTMGEAWHEWPKNDGILKIAYDRGSSSDNACYWWVKQKA
jgi:hypothetical protein